MQITLFGAVRQPPRQTEPTAHIGGSARAYLARLITSSAFLTSGFPRQDGVRGPHIYTGHVVPRTLAFYAAERLCRQSAAVYGC